MPYSNPQDINLIGEGGELTASEELRVQEIQALPDSETNEALGKSGGSVVQKDITENTAFAHNILSATHDANASTPNLGDLIYGDVGSVWTKLTRNTTSTKKFLTQTGTGSDSNAPAWNTLVVGDLPSMTSAEFATRISNETGSGLLVFATSPTLTTPILGTATGTALDLTVAAAGNDIPLIVTQNDTTNNPTAVSITNAGTGNSLFIDQNGNGIALNIDSEATTASTIVVSHSGTGLGIDLSTVSSTTSILAYLNGNLMTDGRVAVFASNSLTTGKVLDVQNNNANMSGIVEQVYNAGTGDGLFIDQNGNGQGISIDSEATTASALRINSVVSTGNAIEFDLPGLTSGDGFQINANAAVVTGNIFRAFSNSITTGVIGNFMQNNVNGSGAVISITNAGTGNGLFIDQNANGLALNIDKDCTVNNTRTWAMAIASDNAGTGTALGCGIDMSSFAVDEPLLKTVADAINTAGTLTGQIAIDIGGTTYYLYYYTHGS